MLEPQEKSGERGEKITEALFGTIGFSLLKGKGGKKNEKKTTGKKQLAH